MITIKDLSKKYGQTIALDSISFVVPNESIFALVGPNGAGKSTLLKILTQILSFDSGEIDYGEIKSIENFRRVISYLPEQRGLYNGVDVETQLMFFASIRGLKKAEAKDSINCWLKKFDILQWKYRRVSELSKGMQQKVQFISCLISRPRLLFMDEPFSGIDPINFHAFTDVLKEYKDVNRATIFLSTHNMKSVEKICTDIALLNNSKLEINGTVDSVKKKYAKNDSLHMEISCEKPFESIEKIREALNNHFDIDLIKCDRQQVYVDIRNKRCNSTFHEAVCFLSQLLTGFDVIQYSKRIPTIEEIFVKIGNDSNNNQTGSI